MGVENKPSFKTRLAEVTQRFDIAASGVTLVGSMVGLIPIGFTVAFLEFNALTFIGAGVLKEKRQ
jgi:hypothetical protein